MSFKPGSLAVVGTALALCGTPLLAQADLIIDQQQLDASWFVEDVYIPSWSCALQEACVGAPGVRRLLRFDTRSANIAQADLYLGSPAGNPLFVWSPCHGHYHFEEFADYKLLDALGGPVAPGHKQAFCVTDSQRYLSAPWVPLTRLYDCNNQGLQRGWSDVYDATLDCQWIDVTNVPAGEYSLTVRVNPESILTESDYSNNVTSVSVTLPAPIGIPPRPDGQHVPGSLLLVSHAGADVQVNYDVMTCPAPDYNVYYGVRGGSWSYTYTGAVCRIGTTGSAVITLPDPASKQLIWFLLVGTNPSSAPVREGGHGFDSSDGERPLSGVGLCSVESTQSAPSCQ